MPLQNRIDPWCRLHAVPDRGTLMGNRGILHDGHRQIVRPWAHKSWVTCALEFKERKRSPLFGPRRYSELFFLDEATAFAAGHRPCRECRRQRFDEFNRIWIAANLPEASSTIAVAEIDKVLHAERAVRGGGKITHRAVLSGLPAGTLFEWNGEAHLLWANKIFLWSFSGYRVTPIPVDERLVEVLTPASIVKIFSAGFSPLVHSSALAG